MKKIIHSTVTILTGISGFIGGLLWGFYSHWDFEPIILTMVSLFEIIAYLTIPKDDKIENTNLQNKLELKSKNNQNVNVTVNNLAPNSSNDEQSKILKNKNAIIETKKNKIGILFIDDDENFNVVKILKDSKWKKTKTITDINSLDVKSVVNSEIIFVDINGVGRILNLKYEGLDLALMLKQKYPEKKVIIYSANKNSNSFHEAWDIVDSRLEKNALPYQFQKLVEKYSLEFYNE